MQRVLVTLFCCLPACAALNKKTPPPPPAPPPPPSAKAVELEVVSRLKTVARCSDRIWTGFDLDRIHIAVVNSESDSFPVLYAGTETRIAKSDLPDPAFHNLYYVFTRDGQSWVTVWPQAQIWPNKDAFDLGTGVAVHESFHELMQIKPNQLNAGPRMDLLPLTWKPRYYRQMLFSRLVRALRHPEEEDTHLAYARFWFDKWWSFYLHEAQSTTDGYEGYATYAELLGNALAKTGCSATEEDLRREVVKAGFSRGSFPWSLDDMRSDDEGYWIGAAAALLARWRPEVQHWEQNPGAFPTPLQILLASHPPLPDTDAPSLRAGARETAERLQDSLDAKIAPVRQAITDGGFTLLSIPYAWRNQPFLWDRTYDDARSGLQFVLSTSPAVFDGGANGKLEAKAGAVIILSAPPCNEKAGAWHFVIPNSSLSLKEKGRVEINTPEVSGAIRARAADSHDIHWLCAGESEAPTRRMVRNFSGHAE